jgi:4-amino-4-deoxy-L-arabinose transferase-like glycosyltransferase
MPKAAVEWARRRGPEALLAVLAGAVFLGYLGAVDLWGKREQRASAEAIDTIDRGHWLIAEIQGRPRLEKPPLPRWTIAALMRLTGRRDEWMVRLPSAASALGMVWLAYALGRHLAGRSAGLAAGLVLSSSTFFVVELRQAGNDGPLAFFTTLALYAAWRRLHREPAEAQAEFIPPGVDPGARGWATLMYAALGLGFLSKGPIAVILAAVAVLPYLAIARGLRAGLGALFDGRGLLLFLALALCWPIPVLIDDPNAARVWYLEMAQKAGTAGITHHHARQFFATQWPQMAAPWSFLAACAAALPLLNRGQPFRPRIWFPWWWAFGNLAMFCLWKVAKPNYYLPCLPGVAVLAGVEWVRVTRAAREGRSAGARRFLQAHWVVLFVGALVAPVVVHQRRPELTAWIAPISAAMAAGVVASARAWRRGADAMALAPLVVALAFGMVLGYGAIAPAWNAAYSHRGLAATLDRALPPRARTLMFYRELDEGLWFYLRDRDLRPVPGTQPRYNRGADLHEDFVSGRIEWDDDKRLYKEGQFLIAWLNDPRRSSEYVLIRAEAFDLFATPKFFARDLARLVTPVLREPDNLRRHNLVLLHAPIGPRLSSAPRDRR